MWMNSRLFVAARYYHCLIPGNMVTEMALMYKSDSCSTHFLIRPPGLQHVSLPPPPQKRKMMACSRSIYIEGGGHAFSYSNQA